MLVRQDSEHIPSGILAFALLAGKLMGFRALQIYCEARPWQELSGMR